MRTNKTKAKLRSLFRNIDQEKSGLIKKEAFFTILKLHNIKLEDAELNRLTKNHTRAGQINFSDALHSIVVDLDSAVLNEEKWKVPLQAKGAQA